MKRLPPEEWTKDMIEGREHVPGTMLHVFKELHDAWIALLQLIFGPILDFIVRKMK